MIKQVAIQDVQADDVIWDAYRDTWQIVFMSQKDTPFHHKLRLRDGNVIVARNDHMMSVEVHTNVQV